MLKHFHSYIKSTLNYFFYTTPVTVTNCSYTSISTYHLYTESEGITQNATI